MCKSVRYVGIALLSCILLAGSARPVWAGIGWLHHLENIINLTVRSRQTPGTDTADNSGTFNTTGERCAICRKVIDGKKHVLDDEYVCRRCLERHLPKCCCCGGRLRQGYIEYYDGNYCCIKCYNDTSLPRCAECNCPVDDPELPEGGYACAKHRPLAICSSDEAYEVWAEVEDAYTRVFGPEFVLDTVPRIHLMTLPELQEKGCTNSNWIKAFSRTHVEGGHFVHDIYVLKGMSHYYLLEQLAHEGAHCWHYEYQPYVLSCQPAFKEGFCEWVAFKILDDLDLDKQRERQLNNADIDYSRGLRDFLRLEEKVGSAEAVLEYVRNNTTL
ncbi:MAG: hypothetical protein Q4F00_08265 [bacterium]|nr:hypothetical protein [bacterium]